MITVATLEDVSSLEKLVNSAYRGETSKKGWTTEANLLEGKRITEQELVQTIKDKKNIILKIMQNNNTVGCILLVNKETKLYLGMLTVLPGLQNIGIGKQLLQAAVDRAKTLNLHKISLTVISIRTELIAWYKRHGFIETGDREPFPLNDEDTIMIDQPLELMVMEKTL